MAIQAVVFYKKNLFTINIYQPRLHGHMPYVSPEETKWTKNHFASVSSGETYGRGRGGTYIINKLDVAYL